MATGPALGRVVFYWVVGTAVYLLRNEHVYDTGRNLLYGLESRESELETSQMFISMAVGRLAQANSGLEEYLSYLSVSSLVPSNEREQLVGSGQLDGLLSGCTASDEHGEPSVELQTLVGVSRLCPPFEAPIGFHFLLIELVPRLG